MELTAGTNAVTVTSTSILLAGGGSSPSAQLTSVAVQLSSGSGDSLTVSAGSIMLSNTAAVASVQLTTSEVILTQASLTLNASNGDTLTISPSAAAGETISVANSSNGTTYVAAGTMFVTSHTGSGAALPSVTIGTIGGNFGLTLQDGTHTTTITPNALSVPLAITVSVGPNTGQSGSVTIPKLTSGGTTGSITFTNGWITGSVNPT
jgi:hypothetical protein